MLGTWKTDLPYLPFHQTFARPARPLPRPTLQIPRYHHQIALDPHPSRQLTVGPQVDYRESRKKALLHHRPTHMLPAVKVVQPRSTRFQQSRLYQPVYPPDAHPISRPPIPSPADSIYHRHRLNHPINLHSVPPLHQRICHTLLLSHSPCQSIATAIPKQSPRGNSNIRHAEKRYDQSLLCQHPGWESTEVGTQRDGGGSVIKDLKDLNSQMSLVNALHPRKLLHLLPPHLLARPTSPCQPPTPYAASGQSQRNMDEGFRAVSCLAVHLPQAKKDRLARFSSPWSGRHQSLGVWLVLRISKKIDSRRRRPREVGLKRTRASTKLARCVMVQHRHLSLYSELLRHRE